jgi:hypothetical protein
LTFFPLVYFHISLTISTISAFSVSFFQAHWQKDERGRMQCYASNKAQLLLLDALGRTVAASPVFPCSHSNALQTFKLDGVWWVRGATFRTHHHLHVACPQMHADYSISLRLIGRAEAQADDNKWPAAHAASGSICVHRSR